MVEVSKVVTANSCNGIIEERKRRKHNLLLLSALTNKESRIVDNVTNQGLEVEDKVTTATLLGIV